MVKSRMSRNIFMVVSLAFGLLFAACQTTPEEEIPQQPPAEEPVQEPVPEAEDVRVEPEEAQPEPLSQDEIDEARTALRRASLMGANTYFPQDFEKLVSDFDSAVAMGEESPDDARRQLENIILQANTLYDQTVMARKNEYVRKINAGNDALLSIEADLFAPVPYQATLDAAQKALNAFESESFAEAQGAADQCLEQQQRLHYNLSQNIRYVGILKRDTEAYISDAEDNEAFIYASEELESANTQYEMGLVAFKAYQLSESVQSLGEAKKSALSAARLSALRRRQSQTDALMDETRQRLENASRLRVLNDEGVVSDPRPWDGTEFLNSNPLNDLSEGIEPVEIENPELRDLNAPVDSSKVPEDLPIGNEGTAVNADVMEADYLTIATQLWEKGVRMRNSGDFDLAEDYFRQAQAYIDVYEANAVFKLYTVVRRDTATDCLWRIAERADIFGNPFLWPKIWRANRLAIQNPDLIYPGQILAIPPQ